MLPKLDEKDRKLFLLLDFNARNKEVELAKALHITKEALHYRLKRLEQRFLLGYHAVINNYILGYRGFRFYLRMGNDIAINKVISLLQKERNVWELARVEGDWDVMAFFMVRDVEELWEVYKRIRNVLSSDLLTYNLSVFRGIIQYSANFVYPRIKKRKAWVIHGGKNVGIDERDRQILSYLSLHGREKIISLSSALKIPYKTALRRIKRLEKEGVILGYRPTVNLSALNLSFYKIHVWLREWKGSYLSRLHNISREDFHVLNVNEVINGPDFEMEVVGHKGDAERIEEKVQELSFVKKVEKLYYPKIFLLKYFP